jgi:O-antigen ligase
MPGIINTPLLLVVGLICIFSIIAVFLSRKAKLTGNGSEKMMLGFILAIIFSHLSHFYIHGALDSLKDFIPVVVGYFLIIIAVKNENKLNSFILLLVMLSTFLAYEGWRQHETGYAIGGMTPYMEQRISNNGTITVVERIRWYGVFNDPNDLGLALVTVIPFLLNMVMDKKYLLPCISIPIIVSAIYLTNSRGSILAGVVAILSYFVIRFRSKKGLLFGLLLAIPLVLFGPSRMSQMSASESSAHGRIDAWYQGYQMFKSNPIFGVGQGMFTENNPLTAHNSFVLVMAELGIFGMFFFTGLLYYPINWLWRDVIKNPETNLPARDLGLVGAIFGSLFGLLTSMFFLSRSYVLVPYLFMAMAASSTRFSLPCDSDIQPRSQYHLKNIALLTIFLIIFINIIVKFTI